MPEQMATRNLLRRAALALLPTLLIVSFLIYYQQVFDYAGLMVLFSLAIVASAAALFALLFAAAALALPPSTRGAGFKAISAAAGAAAALCAFIFAAAFASNAVWGDVINYRIAYSFIAHGQAAASFLPLSERQRLWMLALGGTAASLLLAGVAFLVYRAALGTARATFGPPERLAFPAKARLVLAPGLICAACVSWCAWAMTNGPEPLKGEPFTAFFGVFPASDLNSLDNARVSAALDDRVALSNFSPPAAFKGRNLIVIFSDALRADRMGIYGNVRDTTPFLSELQRKGTLHRVKMALSTCSETYCGVSSTLSSKPFNQVSAYSLKAHSLLRSLGYRTRFYLASDHRSWNYLYGFYEPDAGEVYDFQSAKFEDMNDDRNLIRALEAAPAADGTPALFHFHLMSTHVSGTKLPEFEKYLPAQTDTVRVLTLWNEMVGTARVGDTVVTGQGLTPEELEVIRNRYDNGVLQADYIIKEIFRVLEQKGYLENSVAVILGDHGDGLGEHGHLGHTRFLYQEDIAVPILFYDASKRRYPEMDFGEQIDVAPTVFDALGLPIPSSWRGVSLFNPPATRRTLHQTRRGRSPCFAVVENSPGQRYKYIRCGSGTPGMTEEFYDLRADPGERENLIGRADGARLSAMRGEIARQAVLVKNGCSNFECSD
jgi:glucan phosphoethanolaminetransferase (alkaline phosphatase superfamily)